MDFDSVYQLYFKDVYLYLRSLAADENLAEELAQETFFKAMKAINRFDGRKDIRAWLFTIAKNTYFSYLKKEQGKEQLLPEDIPDERIDFVEKLSDEEDAFEIHKFLHTMAEPYKEVFTLRVFGELPFEKIGLLFGKTASWARVTYYRAKKKIIEKMEEFENE